jgi:uncharacterized repeat protein (TIGR01451 family)
MFAGVLQTNPNVVSPGVGPVELYNNRIQANLSADDGGGVRFLMAGTVVANNRTCEGGSPSARVCALKIYNNQLIDNVSAHEGGGISFNDAPKSYFYNNTVIGNISTSTAITSNGFPAPAGLSTSLDSNLIQNALPDINGNAAGKGWKLWSDPTLFNNLFWNNRAGTRAGGTVAGIGLPGDASAIDRWDLGVAGAVAGQELTPTNSVLEQLFTVHPFTPSNTNVVTSVQGVVDPHPITVNVLPWRTNPNFVDVNLVAENLPPTLLGDYHLLSGSAARDRGVSSKGSANAPGVDFEGDRRPLGTAIDAGVDEFRSTGVADLSITKTDSTFLTPTGTTTAARTLSYTVVARNTGAVTVTGATVSDTPPVLGTVTWSCVASAGSTCPASGTGNLNATVTLASGGTATFTVRGVIPASPTQGTLSNTASITAPTTATSPIDPNLTNNSAVDVDSLLADLSITQTDDVETVAPGAVVHYHVTVSNSGPQAVTGASLTHALPTQLTAATWTCTASAGSSCPSAIGSGALPTAAFNVASLGIIDFTLNATVNPALLGGTISNTVTAVVPAIGLFDPNAANNSATDADRIVVPLPALGLLDNFNRTPNANTLNNGTNWSQTITAGSAALRVNNQQASANATGLATWNNPTTGFTARQGAAFTFANTPTSSGGVYAAVLLKTSGGTVQAPTSYVQVRYVTGTGNVEVRTTTNGNSFNTRGTINGANFASGDTLSAVVYADGTLNVYKTSGVTTTLLGSVNSTFTGTGRIGIQLPQGQRVDDFKGGNAP